MDYHSLLLTNIEIEGLLRTLIERPTPEARALLDERVAAFIDKYNVDDEDIAPTVEQPAPEPVQAPEPDPTPAPEPQSEPQVPHISMTINDQYRFARVMFGSSREALNEAIAKIEAMESLPEAYDYMLNDLDLDVEDDDVKDFITIVAAHFNS